MTRNEFESEWSDEALDDGTVSLSQSSYIVEISSPRAETIYANSVSISYSPSVNSAKRITVNVPQDPRLEGTDYLGGNLKLIIDSKQELDFDIKKIDTSQKEGEDYTIRAFSKGQKLIEIDTEERVSNVSSYDYLADLVDQYNDVSSEHENKVGSTDESLNNVIDLGGNVRGVDSSSTSGSATYSNAGTDASQLDVVYAKIYAPGTDEVDVTVYSQNNNYSETFTESQSSQYGEWVSVSPGDTFNNDTSGYSIQFSLQGDSLLMDWKSIHNQELQRNVVPPDVNVVESGKALYSRSGTELQENTNTGTSSESSLSEIVFDSSSNNYRTRQITEWNTAEEGQTGATSDPDASGGGSWSLFPGSLPYSPTFDPNDTFNDWALYVRRKWIPRIYVLDDFSDWNSNSAEVSSPVYEGTTALHKPDNVEESDIFNDVDTTQAAFDFKFYIYIPSGGSGSIHEIGIEGTGSGEEVFGVIDTSSDTIEIHDDEGLTLDTVSKTVAQDQWLECSVNVNDGVGEFTVGTDSVSASLSTSLTVADGAFIRRAEAYYDNFLGRVTDDFGNTENSYITVTVDGSTLSYGVLPGEKDQYTWTSIADNTFTDWSENLSYADFDIEITQSDGLKSTQQFIDCSVFVHERDNWSPSDFDNTLTNSYLNYPHEYGTGQIEFSRFVGNQNIESSTTNATINGTNNPVSTWGVVQRVDDTTSFPDAFPSSSTVTDEIPYPGVSHGVKAKLTASGALRDTDNPREGYSSMSLSDYSVTVDQNDLSLLYDNQVSGNNLKSMSQIADDTDALFRWEGSYAKIFQIGALKTNPDLKKETVTSSVSIEDSYSSAQVKGLHNVSSPVLTSADAPNWLDQHKTIRDDSIESEVDAISRCRAFLKKNGDIQFSGEITTLPTFAPIGEAIDGSMFNHGQDMIIETVRYRKNRTTISLGYEMSTGSEIVNIQTGQNKSKGRQTSKGMKIPVGEGNV